MSFGILILRKRFDSTAFGFKKGKKARRNGNLICKTWLLKGNKNIENLKQQTNSKGWIKLICQEWMIRRKARQLADGKARIKKGFL